MGYKQGIEKAMDVSADTGELWINGVEVFWSRLRDFDATVPEALHHAAVSACGRSDPERVQAAKEAFWFTVRGIPKP